MNPRRVTCFLTCLLTFTACANAKKDLDLNEGGADRALVYGRVSVQVNGRDIANYCSFKLSDSVGGHARFHPQEGGFFGAWVRGGSHRLSSMRCSYVTYPGSGQFEEELISSGVTLKPGHAHYLGSHKFTVDQKIRTPEVWEYGTLLVPTNPVSQALAAPQLDHGTRFLGHSIANEITPDLEELHLRSPTIRLPEEVTLIRGIKYAVLVRQAEERKTNLKTGVSGRTAEQTAFFEQQRRKAQAFEEADWSFDAFRAYRSIADTVPLNPSEAKLIESRLAEHADHPKGKNFKGLWISRTLTEDGPGWTTQLEAIGDRSLSLFGPAFAPSRFTMTVQWSHFPGFNRYGFHFELAQEWLNSPRWNMLTGAGLGMSVRPMGQRSSDAGFGGRLFVEGGFRLSRIIEFFVRDEFGALSHSSHTLMHSPGFGFRTYY